jgi:hypothetical protein
MPFKSKSQVRALAAKMKQGKISRQTFDEFAAATPKISKLPERVGKRKSRRR